MLIFIVQGIESNFEKYARQMQQQIAEQQRRWDEDMKRKEVSKDGTFACMHAYNVMYTENTAETTCGLNRKVHGFHREVIQE